MALQKLERYRETRFTPDSRPTKVTLIRWLQDGHLPGKQIGRCWYVEVDQEARTTGDHLADLVLKEAGE